VLHDGIAQWLGEHVAQLDYSMVGPANVFLDNMPDSPSKAVAVYSDAGPESDTKLPYDYMDFQVVVRSDADEQWALDVWQAIYDELHGLENVTLPDGTHLVYCIATQSSPFPFGEDADQRPQYSCDFRTEIYRPTTRRPA
jgi:hypothetical protein